MPSGTGPAVSSGDVIATARHSVVKVHGESDSCFKITDGSGFVVAPRQIEFWYGGQFRLHERHLYVREGDAWTRGMLYP